MYPGLGVQRSSNCFLAPKSATSDSPRTPSLKIKKNTHWMNFKVEAIYLLFILCTLGQLSRSTICCNNTALQYPKVGIKAINCM